jgi:hypothetical protein
VTFLLTFEGKPQEQQQAKGLEAGKDKNISKGQKNYLVWFKQNKKNLEKPKQYVLLFQQIPFSQKMR